MKKRKIIILASLFIVFLKVWGLIRYTKWRKRTVEDLRMNGQMAATAVGLMEYAQAGEGATVLLCHDGPGGYDQGYMISPLTRVGFSTLTPSRPGYLGTPLSTGQTIEEQADGMVALMDRLGIEKTAVIGASAGGPIALQMALRHPDRVWAVVMEAGVSQEYHANDNANTPLGRLFMSNSGLWLIDMGLWLLDWFTETFTAQSATALINTESTLSPEQVQLKVDQIMAEPAQIDQFKKLIKSTVPLSLRKAGLVNDWEQLAQVPRYPLAEMDTPTLVIHGRFDADVPYSHAQFVAETVPNADLITLESSGHLIWVGDEWKDVEPRLVKFLKDNAPQ
ncbi:MAG: alpha/beta fold hydrolase [Aquificales bacterium]|nr:alpha/beta fold hydrolase [Aquificales bacterium]